MNRRFKIIRLFVTTGCLQSMNKIRNDSHKGANSWEPQAVKPHRSSTQQDSRFCSELDVSPFYCLALTASAADRASSAMFSLLSFCNHRLDTSQANPSGREAERGHRDESHCRPSPCHRSPVCAGKVNIFHLGY